MASRTDFPAGVSRGSRTPNHIEELSVGRAVRLFSRAFRLRCPHCGGDRLPRSLLTLRPKCRRCGLRTDRGEEDFFLGGMMWNIVLAEGALLLTSLLFGILTWPNVPWELLRWGGLALMLVAPFLFYPLSLCIWLASDILIRPVTDEELAWHRNNPPEAMRKYRER